jgi:hypothetical protein
MLAHLINVAISMRLSRSLGSDACIWYLATNILDNTLGVLLCLSVLALLDSRLLRPHCPRFQSGNYYSLRQQFDQDFAGGAGVIGRPRNAYE